ncbi:heme/hemin ABC transporter substrate-binding protein [Pararhodobacter zhoushanensis]|uniref:ABC transporter substrate-binding protein n=1 Tax=Pararhodobacter zhoushanensis TaxID=2479545 RepID=A0ABT3GWX8_9RHOB|nr:ABC transporter substrate-binding protein [Pararhodobacter zhoushanensis]MCW1932037.1 ABC transporter substrate-binding protein [Pararhodobacter zhoushanensis]
MRLSLIAAACLAATPTLAQERVVVAGSALAEIVAALGASDRLVGRDTTVSYPEALTALPDVGYMRALSAEGLLSLGPDLILADVDAGPQATLDLVAATDVPVVRVTGGYTAQGVIDRIEAVAQALSLDAAPLVGQVQSAFATLAEARADAAPVSAIFVLSAAGGRVLASGQGTAAEGILELAGAQNAITGFDGYRQMTDEAIIAAAPQAIVMMDRSGDHALSDADILAHPALGLTPAAEAGRIIRLDGAFLLGFGPRTPEAAQALMDALEG